MDHQARGWGEVYKALGSISAQRWKQNSEAAAQKQHNQPKVKPKLTTELPHSGPLHSSDMPHKLPQPRDLGNRAATSSLWKPRGPEAREHHHLKRCLLTPERRKGPGDREAARPAPGPPSTKKRLLRGTWLPADVFQGLLIPKLQGSLALCSGGAYEVPQLVPQGRASVEISAGLQLCEVS